MGEIEAAVGASLAAGLQSEAFDAGGLVIGDPKMAALAGDGGQPVAEVCFPANGAPLIEYEGDFADWLVRPRPSAHRGSPRPLQLRSVSHFSSDAS
jgi:hypothetical protein